MTVAIGRGSGRVLGRLALILTAGVFLGLSGAQAAPSTTSSGKPDSVGKSTETVRSGKQRRSSARHRSSKTADKSSDKGKTETKAETKAETKEVAATDTTVPSSGDMPPTVANANAQLAAADTPVAAAATAMSSRASDNVQAAADQPAPAPDNPAPASDQLTEADRTQLQDTAPAQKTVGAAPVEQPRPAPVMASSHSDTSAWEQSSLIGKIFIGFGALLTVASAARMFMA